MPTALAQEASLEIPFEEYQLENGLNVILHHDPALPQVVVNTWYGVGSKDEKPGRSGFAHLFEHLMFMGTERLPGSGFDDLMEAHGGWNNAWTSQDATDYYDVGPSNLPISPWMEADRMDGLDAAMTQDKLDLQREVVRNERRQSSEDTPYGVLWLEMSTALYPEDHPYGHTVIGTMRTSRPRPWTMSLGSSSPGTDPTTPPWWSPATSMSRPRSRPSPVSSEVSRLWARRLDPRLQCRTCRSSRLWR